MTKEEMESQYKLLLDKLQEKEDTNNTLRADYLKEVNHLREMNEMQVRGKLAMKGKDFLNVHFFSFMDGMDQRVCEVLNIKLQQVAEEYNSALAELDMRIKSNEETIKKYKKLSPKTFKLMDLTLDEIFGSLFIIEQDAAKVWTAMTKAYPKGHFDGVIEDTYGTFLDEEAQNELGRSVQKQRAESERQVMKVSDRLCTQIRELEFQLRNRIDEYNKLKNQREYELQDQRDELKLNYEGLLKEKELIMKEKHSTEIKAYEYQSEKNRQIRDIMHKEIDALQKEVFILKLRMISKIIIKYRAENQLDNEEQQIERNKLFFDKIKSLVLGSENSRLNAMLELRKEMLKDYKEKYEKSAQDLYETKLKINNHIDDSDHLRKKIAELQSISAATYQFLNTTRAELRKVKHERDILIDAQRGSLGLLANLEAQKRQLEEKYNINIEKQRNQSLSYKTIQEKTMERFITENHIVFNTSQLLINTDELKQMRKQTIQKVDSQVQTFLNNVTFQINYDTSYLTKQKLNIHEGTKIDQEIQTKLKLEQFDGFLKKREKEQEKLERELARYKKKNQKSRDNPNSGREGRNDSRNTGSSQGDDQFKMKNAVNIDKGDLQLQRRNTNRNINLLNNLGKALASQVNQRRSTVMGGQINFNSKNINLKVNTKLSSQNQKITALTQKNTLKVNALNSKKNLSARSSLVNSNKSSSVDLSKTGDLSKRVKVITEEDEDIPQTSYPRKGPQGIGNSAGYSQFNKKGKRKSANSDEEDNTDTERSFTDSEDRRQRKISQKKIKISINSKKRSQDSLETDEEFKESISSKHQSIKNSPYHKRRSSQYTIYQPQAKDNKEKAKQRTVLSKNRNQELQIRAQNFQQAYELHQTSESIRNTALYFERGDSTIRLPLENSVYFDQNKYKQALNYQKSKVKRQLSKERDARLYPKEQPEVFKRLMNFSSSTLKLDKHLKQLMEMNQLSWIYKLDNMNYLSKDAKQMIEAEGLVRTMNKIIKLGAKKQKPLQTKDQGLFMHIKGIKTEYFSRDFQSSQFRYSNNLSPDQTSQNHHLTKQNPLLMTNEDIKADYNEMQERRQILNLSEVKQNQSNHLSYRAGFDTLQIPDQYKIQSENQLKPHKNQGKARNQTARQRSESGFKKSRRLINNRTTMMQGFLQSLETRAKYERSALNNNTIDETAQSNQLSAQIQPNESGLNSDKYRSNFLDPANKQNQNYEVQSSSTHITNINESSSVFSKPSLNSKRMSHQMPRTIGRIVRDLDKKNNYMQSGINFSGLSNTNNFQQIKPFSQNSNGYVTITESLGSPIQDKSLQNMKQNMKHRRFF